MRGASGFGVISFLLTSFVALSIASSFFGTQLRNDTVAQTLNQAKSEDNQMVATFDGNQTSDLKAKISAGVASAFGVNSSDEVLQGVAYRALADSQGNIFHLVAVPQNLISTGTPLGNCTESSCEVLQVQGNTQIQFPPINILGKTELKNSLILKIATQENSNVFVTTDFTGLQNLPALEGTPGAQIWSKPIDLFEIKSIGPENFLREMTKKADSFSLISSRLTLKYPDALIASAANQSENAVSRIRGALTGLGVALVFVISILVARNREEIEAAARTSFQLSGFPQKGFNYLSTGIAFLPATTLAISSNLILDASITQALVLLGASLVVIILTLELGFILATTISIVAMMVLGIVNREPSLVLIPLTTGMTLAYIKLFTNSWSGKFELTISRSAVTSSLAVIVASTTALIGSWITTLGNLDIQETFSINYKTPTSFRYAGLQSGLFDEAKLTDYSLDGKAFPISKISASTSANGYLSKPVQILALPSGIKLPDQQELGGPNKDDISGVLNQPNSEINFDIKSSAISVEQIPQNVECGVWILNDDGESRRVPAESVGGINSRILGVELFESEYEFSRRQHAIAEGKHSVPAPAGTVVIAVSASEKISFDIDLQDGPVYFPLVEFRAKLHGIASASLASPGDELIVKIGDKSSVTIQVDSVSKRFATAPEDFIILNQGQLNSYLAHQDPALIKFAEIWAESPGEVGNLTLSKIQSWDKSKLISDLQSDPIRNKSRSAFMLLVGLASAVMSFLIITAKRSLIKEINLTEWANRNWITQDSLKIFDRVVLSMISIVSLLSFILGGQLVRFLPTDVVSTWNGSSAFPPIPATLNYMQIFIAWIAALFISGFSLKLGAVRGKSKY